MRLTSLAGRFAVFLAAAGWVCGAVAQTSSHGKPNVLFITVDDLNTHLGCYGNVTVRTPNIDRLAQRGVRFDRAYCQFPVCNPSRTSFLSGLRPDATGILDNKTPPRTHLKDAVFLPQHFRQHGYFTARAGKIFHDGKDNGPWDDEACWDVSEPGVGKPRLRVIAQQTVRRGANANAYYILRWEILDADDADTGDGVVARRTAQLMEKAVQDGKPFFLAAGLRKPHQDFVAPKRYFDLYDPQKIKIPAAPPEHVKAIPRAALNFAPGSDPIPEDQARQVAAAYYACVSFMDAQVGVLLDMLDRLKLWDKTVVVFLGDNGFHLGEHGGLFGKGTLFDGSVRIPLVIAAPGKRAGAASARPVELLDLYPTLTALCGLPVPKDLQGASLVPLLETPDREWSRPAFSQVRNGRSVHTQRYRYTEWADGRGGIELYDLEQDPGEFQNLAGNAQHATTVAQMKRLLRPPAKSDSYQNN